MYEVAGGTGGDKMIERLTANHKERRCLILCGSYVRGRMICPV